VREVITRCQGGWVPAILIPVPLQVAVSARRNPVRSRPQFRALPLQATNGKAAPRLLLLFWVRSFPRVQLCDLGATMFTGGSMDGLGNTFVGLGALLACGTTTGLLAFLAARGRLRSVRFAVSAVGPRQDRTGQDRVRPAPLLRRSGDWPHSPGALRSLPENSGGMVREEWKILNIQAL
jgi:hypothetical protein